MMLDVGPMASGVVDVGAAAILAAHIGGAVAGLIAGGAAMVFQKGGVLHRNAGTVFFVAMLTMSGIGAVVAPFLSSGQAPNTFAGAFTCYLVATGWATVRRKSVGVGRPEVAGLLGALAIAIGAAACGWWSTHTANAPDQDVDPVLFVFAGIAGLAAFGDFRVIRRGGVSGAARISRHLWRMGVALFIAAGSFAGQPKVIPHFLRGSPLILLPALAVALSLIYWLVRVRFTRKFRSAAVPA